MAKNTLYDLLGIPSSATSEEIKSAYKLLAKKYHPDKNPNSTWHEEQFKKVNEAYQLLSNPAKRQQYDSKLHYQAFHSNSNSGKTYKAKPTQTRPKQTRPRNPIKKNNSNWKSYLFAILIFIVISFLGYHFYNFMNEYTAQEHITKGDEWHQKGNHLQALMAYTEAISFDSENHESYYKRGRERVIYTNDFESAAKDFTNAIIYSNNNKLNYYIDRMKCYIELRKFSLAHNDIDFIISQNPAMDSAYYYKGELFYFLNDYKNAIPFYEHYIKKHPSEIDPLLKRGYCFLKTNASKMALSDFDKTISIEPRNGELYYYRALANLEVADTSTVCLDLNYAILLGYTPAKPLFNTTCTK